MERRTMKTLPEGLRPYERLEAQGPETLSDTELISILLKSGNRNRNAVEVAQEVLTRSEGLHGLGELGVKALTEISGVGRVKAITLLAAFEIGRRISKGEQGKKTKIGSIEQLASLYEPVMHLPQEHFKVVLLDRKWQILKDVTVSMGTVDKAIVHPREVFSSAVTNRASGVVVMHNHPSGDCTPSQADRETTRRLIAAGDLLGIVLADHIIYGKDRYYSFFLEGDLAELRSG